MVAVARARLQERREGSLIVDNSALRAYNTVMSKKEDGHTIFTENPGTGLAEKTRNEYPRQYKVLLLNDDFTPMDFVVFLLQKVFHKEQHEAERIMMEIHKRGVGVAGIYSREIAETKLGEAVDLAKQAQHPLQGRIEPCD